MTDTTTRLYGLKKILASISPGRPERLGPVVVLVCYMDDSGTHAESSVVTVAGFSSELHSWMEFEQRASRLFHEYAVDVLNTKKLHATKDDFKGWKREKKTAFSHELSLALRPAYPFGISVSSQKTSFALRKKEYDAWHSHSAFGAAFMRAILIVYDRMFYGHPEFMTHPDFDLSIIMEDGNANNGDALNVFNYLKHKKGLKKLGSMSFAGKRDSYAIQAADFLAFYSRRWMDSCVKAGEKVIKPEMLDVFSQNLQINTQAITDFLDERDFPPGEEGWERVLYPPN